MAIIAKVEFQNGIIINDAYIKIGKITKSKKEGCTAQVCVSRNKDYSDEGLYIAVGIFSLLPDDEDYNKYCSEESIKLLSSTDTEQLYCYMKYKDGELIVQLGFDIDWENVVDI